MKIIEKPNTSTNIQKILFYSMKERVIQELQAVVEITGGSRAKNALKKVRSGQYDYDIENGISAGSCELASMFVDLE